ncbi:TonB-dependent receptor [Ignavibacteria bacterium]|nr:TonB-dependent receptor [Bacteroidota bacterium]
MATFKIFDILHKFRTFRLGGVALLLSLVSVQISTAQSSKSLSGIIRGIDSEATKPLAGATLQWLGYSAGAFADKDGKFNLKRPDGATRLLVRYVGYGSDTLTIAPNVSQIEIDLRASLETAAITVEAESAVISKVAVKTETISSRDLSKSACCSLSESFEKNASAEASYSDAIAGSKQIQLLGLRGIYTQILTEAVPSIRGLAVPFGADYFPGPWMESISISKGAASVISGYESITGQINVELRKSQIADPLFLNGYANNTGRYELNAIATQNLGEHSSAAVMLHGRSFAENTDQNDDGFLDMPKFRQINGLARWYYNDDAVETQVVVRALSDRYDGGQTDFNPETDRGSLVRYGTGTRTNRYETYAKIGLLNAAYDPDVALALVLGGTWHDQQSYFGSREYSGLQKTFYSKALARIAFSDAQYIMAGASWLLDNYDEKFIDTSLRRAESVPGIFLEYTSNLTPHLTSVIGVRTDFHNIYGAVFTPRVHLKYALTDYTSLRASAGSGFRVPNIIADNFSAFANSRRIFTEPDIRPEKAWNYGLSITTTFDVWDMPTTFDAEFFRTDFTEQMIVDFDRSPREIHIGNLQGTSYANSALAQIMLTPAKGFDVTAAWRITDTRATTGGLLQLRPLMSVHRFLGTVNYEFENWQLGTTLIWNGGGRIPLTADNPDGLRLPENFDGFFRANAQISKKFGNFELYFGVENITNYIQPSPIIDAHNPFGQFFDASLVWGPLDERTFYGGFRLTFPRGE